VALQPSPHVHSHNGRGRHWQFARNLTIAVATAALAGGGAALAADGGSGPPTKKPAAGGVERTKSAQKTGDRPPLADNEPVVTDARTRLGGLVADGTISQAEADVVVRDVIAGQVDADALVRAGELSSAHVPAIVNVLDDVKRAHANDGMKAGDAAKAASATSKAERPRRFEGWAAWFAPEPTRPRRKLLRGSETRLTVRRPVVRCGAHAAERRRGNWDPYPGAGD